MSLAPHELSERGIHLVATWSGGTISTERGAAWHVESASQGRLRVHTRSRRSTSLIWFTIPEPTGDGYDAVILIEFGADDEPAAAWKLDRARLAAASTSETIRRGKRFFKVRVGGDWTHRAERVSTSGLVKGV